MASGIITEGKLRYIITKAKTADERRLRMLYDEIYGATPGPNIEVERIRASVIEAAEELLYGR